MRLNSLAILVLPLAAAACGHSDAKSTPTLSVTCDGSLRLAGAASIDVATVGGGTLLSFPDPANPGHTGSLPLSPGTPCTIAPVVDKPVSDKPSAG